jgi:hypothetical protein
MALEVSMGMNAHGVGRKGDRSAGRDKAPIPKERVAATEEVGGWRLDEGKRERWVSAAEAARVVPLAGFVCGPIVIIPAEEQDLPASIWRRQEGGVDGHDIE